MIKKRRKKEKLDVVYTLLEFVRLILVAFVCATFILTFIAKKMEVIGTSMYPTLEENQTVIINVATNFFHSIDRFDVVAVRNKDTQELWVKRVIGLPGETISFKEGVLYVDGTAVEQPFLDQQYVEQVIRENGFSYFTKDYTSTRLGEDEYLLVGDNRNSSLDSRNEAIGPFKREQIIANGVFVVTPFSKARYITNGT